MKKNKFTSMITIRELDEKLEELVRDNGIVQLKPIIDFQEIIKDDQYEKITRIKKGLSFGIFGKDEIRMNKDTLLKDPKTDWLYNLSRYCWQENGDYRHFQFADITDNFILSLINPNFEAHKIKNKNMRISYMHDIGGETSQFDLLDIPKEFIQAKIFVKEIEHQRYVERHNGLAGGRCREISRREEEPTEVVVSGDVNRYFLLNEMMKVIKS